MQQYRYFRALTTVMLLVAAMAGSARAQSVDPHRQDARFKVLHNFQGNPNSQGNFDPLLVEGLVVDQHGNIYGESVFGGGQLCLTVGTDPTCLAFAPTGAEFKLDRDGGFTLFANDTLPGPLNGSLGPMLLDQSGDVTFATIGGGDPGLGHGGVFSLDPRTGAVTTLFSLTGPPVDGIGAAVDVVRDGAGNLYGTTLLGGQNPSFLCQLIAPGCGTVYKLDAKTHQETVLHSFTFNDGFQPTGLFVDSAGNVAGVAMLGDDEACRAAGNHTALLGCGEIFRIDPSGNFSLIHEFHDTFTCPFIVCPARPPDPPGPPPQLQGWNPQFVVVDEGGNTFGVTGAGGNFGLGVIFKIDAAGNYSVLHHFAGPGDGFSTVQILLRDGKLYGINQDGGNTLDCDFGLGAGCGTIFRLDTRTGRYKVLHTFSRNDEGTAPQALAFDQHGDLIGSNLFGGNGLFDPNVCTGGGGCGNIFRLKLSDRGEDDDE